MPTHCAIFNKGLIEANKHNRCKGLWYSKIDDQCGAADELYGIEL